jgi:hypothetical protein
MRKRSRYRLRAAAQLVATISVLTACSSGDALEHHASQAAYSNAGAPTRVAALADARADTAPSTMVELQHFDAYEYYRDVFDLHVAAASRDGTRPAAEPASRGDAGDDFLSCFSRFK